MFKNISEPQGLKLELATSKDLPHIKALDDLAFANQEGISLEDLAAILDCGAIILLKDASNGNLVGESQILLEKPTFLDYRFPAKVAFYYGTGIDPKMQRRGFGKILAKAQDEVARANRKTGAELTVRVENYESLKLRFSAGFLVTKYLPEFYGTPEQNGARLLMTKRYEPEERRYRYVVRMQVVFGTSPDLAAHRKIAEMLSDGYVGFDVERNGQHNPPGMLFGK